MQFDRDIVDFFYEKQLYWHFENDKCQFILGFSIILYLSWFHLDKLSSGGGDADTVHRSGLSGKCVFIQ